MVQMYRIYINEIKLFITENVPNAHNSVKLLTKKEFDIHQFYEQVKLGTEKTDYFLIADRPHEMFDEIVANLQVIEAAGGLVTNETGAYLFIFRRGKWDLPKGKIDEGESPEMAAVREVEEECGVQISKLGELLSVTYHIYPTKKELVLKKTYWYDMEVSGSLELIPQIEEEITEAVWLKTSELNEVKQNSYPLIIDLLEEKLNN
jgi:8-oxo-dGTP pyrophosphatase MutT (NUDIX family)